MSLQGKAAVCTKFGAALEMRILQYPDPGPDEVLVKMKATGICHTDLHAIRGDWPVKPHPPFVPGHEGVGVVIAVGTSVRNVKEGDRVGLPWIRSACGSCEWCVSGWETLCPNAVYGGYSANGSFAEYALTPAAFAVPIPDKLSDTQAAPVLCAGLTTWKALKEAELTAGNWVAISGIGGLGHMALQYAKKMGLHVAAIDVAEDKLQLARELKADLIIHGNDAAAIDTLVRETGGAHGVIITAPSETAFRQGILMTRRKGTCVLVGLPPGDMSVPIFDIVLKRVTIRGSLVGTRADMAEALSLAADSAVMSSNIERPFSEVNAALDALAEGKVRGRTVLTF